MVRIEHDNLRGKKSQFKQSISSKEVCYEFFFLDARSCAIAIYFEKDLPHGRRTSRAIVCRHLTTVNYEPRESARFLGPVNYRTQPLNGRTT